MGNALQEMRRFEEAISAHRSAAALYRETGDRHREGGVLNNLGIALRMVRQFEEAITAHKGAAAIFRETGDQYREGVALCNLELDQTIQRS
jgi:tetratricopeptide (TPR) repeat protein